MKLLVHLLVLLLTIPSLAMLSHKRAETEMEFEIKSQWVGDELHIILQGGQETHGFNLINCKNSPNNNDYNFKGMFCYQKPFPKSFVGLDILVQLSEVTYIVLNSEAYFGLSVSFNPNQYLNKNYFVIDRSNIAKPSLVIFNEKYWDQKYEGQISKIILENGTKYSSEIEADTIFEYIRPGIYFGYDRNKH